MHAPSVLPEEDARPAQEPEVLAALEAEDGMKARDESLPTPDDYQRALDAQNGCNLSGIVHDFSRVVTRIWNESNKYGKGTEFVNRHPISLLYADKVANLAGVGQVSATAYEQALKVCEERAKKTELQQFVEETKKEGR